MPDYTPYQKKIINRYYDHRDTILLGRLQEIVTELFLATTPAAEKRLWKRVESSMRTLKVPEAEIAHIMGRGDAKILADHVRDWLAQASKAPGKR